MLRFDVLEAMIIINHHGIIESLLLEESKSIIYCVFLSRFDLEDQSVGIEIGLD